VYDLISAELVSEKKIKLTFDNGKSGIVDFSEYANKGGVFLQFNDSKYFSQYTIHPELKVLTWPDGVDVSPETLYHKATGEPLPSWMCAV
jgi:hypothetical protein